MKRKTSQKEKTILIFFLSIKFKKMKKHLFSTLLFFCFVGISYSQSMYEMYQLKEATDFFKTDKLKTSEWKSSFSENNIEGTPYLMDEFAKGSIFTITKQHVANVPLRYNIYNDEIEYLLGKNEIQAMANPEIVERIVFADYNIVYLPYTNSKKIKSGFFIILEEGNASLYSKPKVKYKKASEPNAYNNGNSARFIKNPDQLYIKVGKEQAKLVGNKKDLVEIFPDNKDKVKAFIKKSKIKTKNQESLLELVQYYNSLKE